jgi:hypothetical protein
MLGSGRKQIYSHNNVQAASHRQFFTKALRAEHIEIKISDLLRHDALHIL